MPRPLVDALSDEAEVIVTVAGKDGRQASLPVWFVLEGRTMLLLPMYGLKTRWFQRIKGVGTLGLEAGQVKEEARARIVYEREFVEAVKRKFALKYGHDDVKKYYPTSDVALAVEL